MRKCGACVGKFANLRQSLEPIGEGAGAHEHVRGIVW